MVRMLLIFANIDLEYIHSESVSPFELDFNILETLFFSDNMLHVHL